MSRQVSPAMIGSFVVSGIVLVVAAVIIFGSGTAFDKKERFVAFATGRRRERAAASSRRWCPRVRCCPHRPGSCPRYRRCPW